MSGLTGCSWRARGRLVSTRRLVPSAAIGLVLALALQGGAVADDDRSLCGHGDVALGPFGTTIEATGEQRALFVFARFPDGQDVGGAGDSIPECSGCGPGWPSGTTSLPVWAHSLLEDTDTPAIPGSLTHFFHEMSGGTHILRGVTLDTVVTSDTTIAWYHDNAPTGHTAILRANRHILEKVDSLVDFSEFDLTGDGSNGPDGRVDYVFIYYQSVSTNDSGTVKRIGGDYAGYSQIVSSAFDLDSTTIAVESGSVLFPAVYALSEHNFTVIRHRWQVAALAAHEYGHDLVYQAPYTLTTVHLCAVSRYGIMQGYTIPPVMLMEGIVRHKLGWISPPVVPWPQSFPFDTTIALSASYRDADASFVIVETEEQTPGREQYFLLEARRDSLAGGYDTPQPPDAGCCVKTLETGTGLLISHIREQGNDLWSPVVTEPPLVDIEVGSGRFGVPSGVPDPVSGHSLITSDPCNAGGALGNRSGRPGDLFQPSTGLGTSSNTFAPYTNPNTNLYNEGSLNPTWQGRYSGITIDQIRWTAGGDSILARIHIEDPANAPVHADTLKVDTVWRGLVQLTGDLVVAPGVSLTAEEGTWVVLRAGPDGDRFERGADPERVEVIVPGTSDLRGDSGAGVEFTSSRDNDFTHPVRVTSGGIASVSEYPGEDTDPAPGDWYSLRFKDVDPNAPPSSVREVDFDFPVFAIEVDSLGGTLYRNRFANADSADIHVRRDVRIPAGQTWDLYAPTRVLVNHTDPDGTGEDPDRVEILDHGDFFTSRPAWALSTDWVWFTVRAAAQSPGAWAGIVAELLQAKGSVKDADIGYAVDPLRYTYLMNTATVEDSNFHHYTGIGFLDEWSRASVIGNRFRGSGSATKEGGASAGIKSIFSLPRIEGNTVDWHREHGIKLEWTKAACLNTAVEDSVFVAGNTLTGAGEDNSSFNLGTGLAISWGCAKRHLRVVGNTITAWFNRGVDLLQCAETRLACNDIIDNRQGLGHSRDGSQTETDPVRLRANTLHDSYDVNLWLDDAVKLKLYDSGGLAYAKENGFMPDSADAGGLQYNIDHQDGSLATLDARYSHWMSGSGETLADPQSQAYVAYLRARIRGNSTKVNINDPLSAATTLCAVSGMVAGGVPEVLDSDRTGAGVPRVELQLAGSGGFDRTTFLLGAPQGARGVRVRIYDVRGRLVASVLDEAEVPAGERAFSWNRRDQAGTPVASGVYFVRLDTSIGAATAKLVVVR